MAHRLFGRADWLLMVTLLASYAYFFQAGAWNLGQLVGLPGLWSLVPLFILWGVCLCIALDFPSRRKCS